MRVILFLALVASFFAPPPARAVVAPDACTHHVMSVPAVIGTPGTYCVNRNMETTTSGTAITITSSNVTLDCRGHHIVGAGNYRSSIGVYSSGAFDVTIRNCILIGFGYGIAMASETPGTGGGHLVEDNHLHQNLGVGIYVSYPNSRVHHNMVTDTGLHATFFNPATAILGQWGVHITDNIISGVHSQGSTAQPDAPAFGIRTQYNGDGSIVGNEISQIFPASNGEVYGIRNQASGRMPIQGNRLRNLVRAGYGITCNVADAAAVDNLVSGFATGVQGCLSDRNIVN